MLKPKSADRQHWDTVSDEDLLHKELTTDNPLGVENLVSVIPDGSDEPYVESSYDLEDEVPCVHGRHRHKHGFVFRKGEYRYLVGWMCGEKIYGTKFNEYAADHKAARVRQDAGRRVQELKVAVEQFSNWATSDEWQDALAAFENVRDNLLRKMPAVSGVVRAHAGHQLRGALMPKYLCYYVDGAMPGDPRNPHINDEYTRFLGELQIVAADLSKPALAATALLGKIVEHLRGVARRARVLLDKFEDVERFFQPSTLAAICEELERMTPRQKKHYVDLLKIRNKELSVGLPRSFRMPDRKRLEEMERVLSAGRS